MLSPIILLIILPFLTFLLYHLTTSHLLPTLRTLHLHQRIPLLHPSALSLPATHTTYLHQTRPLHSHGYTHFTKHSLPYRVHTSSHTQRTILPLKYLSEIKNAPQNVMSLPEEMAHLLLMNYTGVPQRTDSGTRVVRVDLTRRLGGLVGVMAEEVKVAFGRWWDVFLPAVSGCKVDDDGHGEMEGDGDDGEEGWVKVKIYAVLAQIVAQVSGRVLVGEELGRDEEWLRISVEFSGHAFGAARELRAGNKWPWSMWLASWTSPAVRKVREGKRKAEALLRPICEERLARMAAKGSDEKRKDVWQKPEDGNQWLLDSHSTSGESVDEVVRSQLRITMAAIHNTTMSVTNDVFDMLAHPEYIPILREEVQSVLREERGWTKQALTKLRKMDSVMKESQRMNPSTMLTVKRKVLQDFRLHDGLVIPRGSQVAFASDGINRDPEIYDKPDEFDGLRFHRLREAAGQDGVDQPDTSGESKYQFVTATADYFNWGHGKNACPGRFFASNEIKLILAHLLQHYDLRWIEGDGRPQSLVNDWNILPDREKLVEVRRRRVHY